MQPGKLALVGAQGMLAGMVRSVAPTGIDLTEFDLPEFDLTDRDQVMARIAQADFDLIINCAAYTNVDGCEAEEALATRVNGVGPGYLAEAALACGATLVHISTDYVFAGDKVEPYLETDPVGPQTAYGRSKLAGEQAIPASGLEKYFLVRTSWLYGPGGKNFVETILRLAHERDEIGVVADQFGSPTFTGDLAAALFKLLRTCEYGTYHFCNSGACSWFEFAGQIVRQAAALGLLEHQPVINPLSTEQYPLPARRPAYSVLGTEKYRRATDSSPAAWQDALQRYLAVRG